jgi:ribosome-associated heat shock protein Hsp15
MAAMDAVRVDRWLAAARVFKSRTLASAACVAGHVTLNGKRAKADQRLRPGDLLEVQTEVVLRILAVQALADKRLSAPLARELYEDRTPPAPPRVKQEKVAARERGSGRPTKRERRQIDRLRSS